jgi:hypothetical protein
MVAAALLAFVFSRVPLGSVIEAMRGADRTLLALAFIAALAVQFFSSARLKVLLAGQGVRLSVRSVFEINLATRFYGLFLPGGNLTGMGIRVLKVSRLEGNVAAAGAAVLADRVIATLMLCMVGVAFWLLERPHPDLVWPVLFLGCAVVLVLVLCLMMRPVALRWLRRRIPRRMAGKLDSIRTAFGRSGRLRERVFAHAMALSAVTHLAGVLCYWLVLASMALGLSPIAGGWIRSVVLFVTLLPISLAGLGVREAGAYLVMRSFGLDGPTAVTFSLLITLVSVIGPGAIGGVLESLRFLNRGHA